MGVAVSEIAGVRLEARGASVCKWVGAVSMLFEHVNTHALERYLASFPQIVGTLAFPFFVVAFGALAGPRAERWESIAYRLGFLALAAQALGYLVAGREAQLNVLATFAFGALVAAAVQDRRWWMVPLGVGLGAWCEFNVAGVGAIAAALLIGNDPRGGVLRWLVFALCVFASPLWNPSAHPEVMLVAWVLAAVVVMLPLDMPDKRGGFAVGYVAQWPVLRLIRDARDFLS